MVLGTSEVRLIDMTRAFAAVSQRGVASCPMRSARSSPPTAGCSTSMPGRRARAGRALGRGRDDRLAADRGAVGHRPRRADRPAGRGQDRDDQLEQGRLVHRFFERADHRRVDGPRRCPAGRRPAGRHRAGARVPRFHERRGRQAPGREVRDSKCRCPTGSSSPTRKCGAIRSTETCRWSMPTAIRSARCRRPTRWRPAAAAARRAGRPDQQWLDEVLDRRPSRAAAPPPQQPHRRRRRAPRVRPRPNRFSRGPSRRSSDRAAPTRRRTARASSALKPRP